MNRILPFAALSLSLFSIHAIAAEQAYGTAWTLAFIEARVATCQLSTQPNLEQVRQAIRTDNTAEAVRAVQAATLTCAAIAAAPIR